ncbi:hypothetical protein C7458_12121 [Williamsia muralis]|nr:hypothetical protein C7458_12121 [Williamsia marianensis]
MSVRPANVPIESLANRTIPPVLGPLPPVPTPSPLVVSLARLLTPSARVGPGGPSFALVVTTGGARLLMVAGRGPRPVNPRPGGVARSPLRCARALQPLSHPHSLRSRESGFRPPGLFGVDSPPLSFLSDPGVITGVSQPPRHGLQPIGHCVHGSPGVATGAVWRRVTANRGVVQRWLVLITCVPGTDAATAD